MEVGNNVQQVYRPSIDYRDVFLTYWKKDSKPYVFLLPIPDSSRAVGEPIQPPRSPLVSDAKIENAAEKRSKPGLNVEWNRGSAFYSSSRTPHFYATEEHQGAELVPTIFLITSTPAFLPLNFSQQRLGIV